MRYHRVDVSCGNEESKARFSELHKIIVVLPIRLCKNRNTIAAAFKKSCKYCRTKRRMVHISVAGYKDEVNFVPAAFFHIFFVNR